MTEKIFAAHANVPFVSPGDLIGVTPDVVFTYDVHMPLLLRALGRTERLSHPRILVFDDHFSINPEYEEILSLLYEFAEKHGVTSHFLDTEKGGVCHSIIRDNYALPGSFIAGTDSHTPTCGIYGALGLVVGATEAAAIMKNGSIPITVPESIKVSFKGHLDDDCSVKDIVLYLLSTDFVRGGKTNGRFLEFDLSMLQNRSADELTVLCNMAIEMGAWGGIAIPGSNETSIAPDKNASYADTLQVDLSDIVPAVALPHSPANYLPISKIKEAIQVHKVFIGSCTGGLLHDIQIAADFVKGSHVAKSVKLFVQPSSNKIYDDADKIGLLDIIRDAGGIVLRPGCGGCIGQGEAAIGSGENGVWNSNRNYQGRVGSPNGNVYIASTQTAVLAAIRGELSGNRYGM